MSRKSQPLVSVVRSLAEARLLLELAEKRGIAANDVQVLTAHVYLARHIQGEVPEIRTTSFDEIRGAREAISATRRRVEEAEASVAASFSSSAFGWITLWQWYSGYMYEREISRTVSQILVREFSHHHWIFWPRPLRYGNNFNSTRHQSSVWDVAMLEAVRKANISYEFIGQGEWNATWGRVMAQAATTVVNLFLTLVAAFISTIIGFTTWWRKRPPGGRILNMSPDTYVFSDREHLQRTLGDKNISIVEFRLHQIAIHMDRRFGGLLSFLLHLAPVWRGGGHEAPVLTLDSRRAVSQYWAFELWPDAGALVRVVGAFGSALLAWEKLWGALDSPSWWERVLVLSWLPQCLLAQAQGQWLLARWQPRAVLFPGGHSPLLRYLQWQVNRGRLMGINAPHGYPNRRWPRHYEAGNWYIAPTRLSERQGHPADRIIPLKPDKLTLSPRAAGKHITEGAIGILYPGTTGGWAHPNDLDELWQTTLDTVRALHKALPNRHIILKSHPNGTEAAFFTAVIRETGIPAPYLQHVPQGWNEKQFQELACGITLVVLPSSPVMDSLRFGIPLVAVAGPSFKHEHYFQSSPARLYDFPFLAHSPEQGVENIVSWLGDEASYKKAEQTMLDYGSLILNLKTSHPSMAEVLSQLVH